MKRNSKIRYAGVAAAALLAVAPVAAPAISASTTLPVVQAATDTKDTDADAPTKINLKGVAISSLTAGGNPVAAAASVDITDNVISAVYTADGTKITNLTTAVKDTLVLKNSITLYDAEGNGAQVNTFNLTSDSAILEAVVFGTPKDISKLSFTGKVTEVALDNPMTFANANNDAAQVYSNMATTIPVSKTTISGNDDTLVLATVEDADGNVVAYKVNGGYVKASDVTTTELTKLFAKGSIKTSQVTTGYKYTTGKGFVANDKFAKGQTLDYTATLVDQDGNDFAYLANGNWIKASDVTTSTDSDLTVSTVPAGSQTINSGNKAVVVYNDAATTDKSGSTLSTDYAEWSVTRVAKDADGKVVAYDLGNGQWVKASDVTTDDNTTDGVKVSNTVSGDALYSNWKAAPIYSDPAATKQIRTLSTSYNEWSAFKVSKDASGKIIAYDLGGGQWVKASDLVRQVNLAGTFYTTAGTALTNVNGDKTGTISATGSYQIFAVRYINGHQSLKLGDDSQWIVAANGDYYPA